MSNITSVRAIPAEELKETMTGSSVLIGRFEHTPVIAIFNNLGSAEVVITLDDVQWMTFAPGQAIVLDMRANHGLAPDYTLDKGTSIYGNGASGDFSVAYLYAKE